MRARAVHFTNENQRAPSLPARPRLSDSCVVPHADRMHTAGYGKGRSGRSRPSKEERELFLAEFLTAVGLLGGGDGHAEQPAESHDVRSVEAQLVTRLHSDVSRSARVVLVAASMGGVFGLPFLRDHPSVVAAFVPIAPAGAEYLSTLGAPARQVRTVAIFGEMDRYGERKPNLWLAGSS